MLDKVLRIAKLYDFYGALLTERQRQCIEMHYLSDLSLGEIANEQKVSRQAVHDILRRAEQLLEDYEAKLCLVARNEQERRELLRIASLLGSLPAEQQAIPAISESQRILARLLDGEGRDTDGV